MIKKKKKTRKMGKLTELGIKMVRDILQWGGRGNNTFSKAASTIEMPFVSFLVNFLYFPNFWLLYSLKLILKIPSWFEVDVVVVLRPIALMCPDLDLSKAWDFIQALLSTGMSLRDPSPNLLREFNMFDTRSY